MPGNPSASTAGTYLLMMGADKAAGEALEVRKLGVQDLRSAVHEHSFAFAHELAGSTSVRFSGPSLELAMAGKGLHKTPAVFPEAIIAFAAPQGADPQNCVLLWLGPSAASWVEVDSVVTTTGGSASIHAKVSEIGTYALAQLEIRPRNASIPIKPPKRGRPKQKTSKPVPSKNASIYKFGAFLQGHKTALERENPAC